MAARRKRMAISGGAAAVVAGTFACAHICVLPSPGEGQPMPQYPPPCVEGFENESHLLVIETGLPDDDKGQPTQLHALARLMNFDILLEQPGGSLGGELQIFNAELQLHLFGTGLLEGFEHAFILPVLAESHTSPPVPDRDAFTFSIDTAFENIHGAIFDDKVFEEFHLFAGIEHKMACPGHASYTLLPSGEQWVNSHFDLHCHIMFVGADGNALEGVEAMSQSHAPMHAGSPICAADADMNMIVNDVDLLAVLDHWGPCRPIEPGLPCQGDVNRNGQIDVDDLLDVINAWGSCPEAM